MNKPTTTIRKSARSHVNRLKHITTVGSSQCGLQPASSTPACQLAPLRLAASAMPAATALDAVDICIAWAKARKVLRADPVQGSRTIFDIEECKKKFEGGHAYEGVACNIFSFNLKQWAVLNQKVSLVEAKDYAQKNFPTDQLLKYYNHLVKGDEAPKADPPKLGFQVSVAVLATGSTKQEASLGAHGAWRKISADPQTYGFLYALSEMIKKTPATPATIKVMEVLEEMALHYPIDVYPFMLEPEIERNIFLKSFQIMENFRKREEEQAPSAWKICCLWDQGRQMIDGQKDVNDGLVELFSTIEFAASSEYKMENLKKKIAKDCLTFYDRAVAAGIDDLMPRVRIELSPKNALDQLSKMVKISQVAAYR